MKLEQIIIMKCSKILIIFKKLISGKWYYSLEEHYRFPYETDEKWKLYQSKIIILENCIQQNNYYPVYGSVRVAWPHFQIEEAGQNKRKFGKNKPTYKD